VSKDFFKWLSSDDGMCRLYSRKGGQLSKNGRKEKGMVHLTERRAGRTRWVHTVEYWGKMDFCHTLVRVNTI
jgi:hypothetical protein